MTAVKKVNYTDAQTEQAKAMYAELGNDGLAEIAAAIGKPLKSVRAKLVREQVYVAPKQAPKAAKDEGPTKKDILASLEANGFNTDGGLGATKDFLARILTVLPRA